MALATLEAPAPVVAKTKALHKDLQLQEHAYKMLDLKVDQLTSMEDTLDPTYLWNIHGRLERGAEILVHDELYRWEFSARVIKIDKELQIVVISVINGPIVHVGDIPTVQWDEVKVQRKGPRGSWAVLRGTVMLHSGFESQADAEAWVAKKKKEAAG